MSITTSSGVWYIQIIDDQIHWSAPMTSCSINNAKLEWNLSVFVNTSYYRSRFRKVNLQLNITNKISDSYFVEAYYTILVRDCTYGKLIGNFFEVEHISNEKFTGKKYVFDICIDPAHLNVEKLWVTVDIKFKSIVKIANFMELNTAISLNQMSDDLSILLNDDKHSDVVLKTFDNIEIPAHKCLLTARSSVFAAMFKHDMKENQEKYIAIDDVDSETLQTILKFIYTGKFKPTVDGIFLVLAAADKYDIKGLLDLCETEILNNMNVNNAITALVTADKHHLQSLKEKSCKFLAMSMRNNLNEPIFQTLRKENPFIFDEILNVAISNDILE